MLGLNFKNHQIDRFLRIWLACSALALIGSTYPLWFPGSIDTPFPQIPLLQVACAVPIAIDWIASGTLIFAWLLFASGRQRLLAAILLVSCTVTLVTLNQHRFQPWLYQLVLSVLLIASPPPSDRRQCEIWLRLLRFFTISIYIYSALSKFDFEFLHTVGAQMFASALAWVGVEGRPSPAMVMLLPATELILGLALCWPRTRRLAGFAACIFHGGLVLLLSPIGLDHSLGVLIWNAHFVGLCLLLFVLPHHQMEKPSSETESSSSPQTPLQKIVFAGIFIPAVSLPLLERVGVWDHWPSWALYAPHSSRVRVRVATSYLDRLPEKLQQQLELAQTDGQEDSLWTFVPFDEWSLKTCYAPVYPQARFQLGIARYLSDQVESEFGVEAELLGTASRWEGQRERKVLDTRKEIQNASSVFILNTQPRLTSR